MDIYVQKNGQQVGPYPETKIRQGIDTGEFTAEDLAWMKGRASWQPLSALILLDVTQPPPISTPVPLPSVVELSESPSETFLSNDRIELPPDEDGQWKRQHNCKKCDAPFKTFTVGTLKATDICDVCTRKRSRVIGACFTVFLIVAFVADRILAREHEDQIKKANAYVSSLSNPKPHATPDDNAFLFPPNTPRPIVSSSGLRLEPNRVGTNSMAFPTIPPLAETLAQAQSLSTNEQHVGLRKSETVFLASYGKVYDSYLAEPPEPAGTKVDWFYHEGLCYMVLFWNEIAQNILVIRKDGKELTEDNIRTALNKYADGEIWKSAPSADASVIKHWERDGAGANLGKHHDNGRSRGANNPDQFLQIATVEYLQQFSRGR